MNVFSAENNNLFRASTQKQLWLSHQRKRCACGAVITERQQKQQGRCNKCAKEGKDEA